MVGCGSINPDKTTNQIQQLLTQQQQPNSNCNTNTVSMVGCGTINPDKTTTSNPATTSTQQQQPFNCGTNNMMMCGSTINPDKTTTSNPATTSTQQQQQPDSNNCNTKFMVGCGSTINPDKTTTSNPTNQPSTTIQNPTTNLGGGPTNQLVNPTAFNYQTNPATPSVDISKNPTQKISSAVTNSFGQGVPNIPVIIQVKDPAGKTAFLSTDKTDNNGKNVVSFPVKTAGTWTALVVISSNATVGGPFSDQITWNAISGGTHSNLTSLVNLARTIVTLSDDPREQIITTVKDPTGKGVKDIALRIKLTNPDAVSTTFSRITDANGVDQFVIPVDKVGNWVATLTLKDPNGETVPITDVAWKAIP